MKHPFWGINSILCIFLGIVLILIYSTRVVIPHRESIEPVYVRPKQDQQFDINIKKIYENDLFDTYRKEIVFQKRKPPVTFPDPPQPQVIVTPDLPKPEFFDPLDITLKGIVIIGTHRAKNRAIISDNKTQKENPYKVGDRLEDAQLLKIFRNKIVLLRSNGQQEVLYLREQDAKFDPAYTSPNNWEAIAQQLKKYYYIVNMEVFSKHITNVAQFIDMLALTTAYQKGESIGCRVGRIKGQSLGVHLGLLSSDIITHVNGIPATNTAFRLQIYNKITTLKDNDTIKVNLLRNKKEFLITYTLQATPNEAEQKLQKSIDRIQPSDNQSEQKKDTELQKKKFTSVMKKMNTYNKRMMFAKGKLSHNNK